MFMSGNLLHCMTVLVTILCLIAHEKLCVLLTGMLMPHIFDNLMWFTQCHAFVSASHCRQHAGYKEIQKTFLTQNISLKVWLNYRVRSSL